MIGELLKPFIGLLSFFERDIWMVLWDLADIVLVAVVLYYLLLILKGTRAMQIGIGLGLVFVVYQMSKRLGLVTLFAMLDTFITSLVLIIIVIFQHDIRRALMRFGRSAFFTSARAALESQVIEEVVKAAMALAKRRIGALIVFERDALLDDFIEQGTVLDAGVSKELIYSIFIPSLENPVHDGAVIVRDGRLWQAGAFLPLARTSRMDSAFGTRHRAAIGITEETDAVVVVVSEERGSVSLCFNGNIVPNLDASSLRKVLIRLSYKTSRQKKKGVKEEPAEVAADSPSADASGGGSGEAMAGSDDKNKPGAPEATKPAEEAEDAAGPDGKNVGELQ